VAEDLAIELARIERFALAAVAARMAAEQRGEAFVQKMTLPVPAPLG
jgi:hypothetical protein